MDALKCRFICDNSNKDKGNHYLIEDKFLNTKIWGVSTSKRVIAITMLWFLYSCGKYGKRTTPMV